MNHPPTLQLGKSREARGPRDLRLDFWRGLCLLDMVLVHLVYERVNFGTWLTPVLGEYVRFAAGGFIFMAGLGIGAIFLPRALDPETRWRTYRSLGRRAFYILLVHIASTISFLVLDLLVGNRQSIESPGRTLFEVLTLRQGDDLLPFYVVMIGVAPLLLDVLRRRLGWFVLAATSAALFIYGGVDPWALSTPIHHNFPVILWQTVFVAGLLFGANLKRYDALPFRIKRGITSVVVTMFGLLFVFHYAPDFGWNLPALPMTFAKVPLSLGELLRYFTIFGSLILCIDLAWNRIARTKLVAPVALLGRRSLAVYVAHVWIITLCTVISWKIWWIGAWQGLLAVGAIAALLAYARGLDWLETLESDRFFSPRSRWGVTFGAGVVSAALMLGINPRVDFTLPISDPMAVVLPPNVPAPGAKTSASLNDESGMQANQDDLPDPQDDLPDPIFVPDNDLPDTVRV